MPKKRFYQVRCEIMFHTPNLLLDLYCLIETFCGNLENKHNKGSFLKNTRSFKKTKKKRKKEKTQELTRNLRRLNPLMFRKGLTRLDV